MKFRMPYNMDIMTVAWRDLTLEEQSSLIKQGYKPADGEILYGNMDLEISDKNHYYDSTDKS